MTMIWVDYLYFGLKSPLSKERTLQMIKNNLKNGFKNERQRWNSGVL
jgi:hypothetical protein